MNRVLFLFFLVLGLLSHSLGAKAAMINVLGWDNPNVNPSYVIEGDIVEGDYDKFKEVVFEYGALPYTVRIYSKGGNVVEAMKIGRMIRDLKFGTYVAGGPNPKSAVCYEGFIDNQANCTCQSACFFIYAGGIDRSGGTIGIHRAYLDLKTQKDISADEASAFSKEISDAVAGYLTDMGVAQKIIDEGNFKSSDEINWIKQEDVENYLTGYIPELDDWFIGNCGSLQGTYEPMVSLIRKRERQGLSESEEEELDKIIGIRSSRMECRKKKERDLRLDAFSAFGHKNYEVCKNILEFENPKVTGPLAGADFPDWRNQKPFFRDLIGKTEDFVEGYLRCFGIVPKEKRAVNQMAQYLYQDGSNLDYIHYGIEIVYEKSEKDQDVVGKIVLHLKHSGSGGDDYYGFVYAGTVNVLKNRTMLMDEIGLPKFLRDNRENIGLTRLEVIKRGSYLNELWIYKTGLSIPTYAGFEIVPEASDTTEHIPRAFFLNQRKFENLDGKIVTLDEYRGSQ